MKFFIFFSNTNLCFSLLKFIFNIEKLSLALTKGFNLNHKILHPSPPNKLPIPKAAPADMAPIKIVSAEE